MPRLIDADALMKTLGITDTDCRKCAWYEQAWTRCRRGATFSDACCAIEHAPTIEERKTGEWILLDKDNVFFTPHMVKCPFCGNILDRLGVNAGRGDANFCPNCGADMRGGA